MSKNDMIREFVLAQVGRPYIYGATGTICAPKYRQARQVQYPAYAPTIARHCPVLSGRQSTCAGCKWDGMRAYDCAQLTRRAAEAAGLQLPSGAKSQFNGPGWVAGGPIELLPFAQVAFLYRKTADGIPHTGIYTGDGWVVDARGHAQGVVRTLLHSYKWTDFRVLYGQELVPGVPLLGGEPEIKPTKKGEVMQLERDLMVVPGQRLMRGQDVLDVQAALLQQGFSVGDKGADGIYGKDTEAAVRDFQAANGLAVTGVWGPADKTRMQELIGAGRPIVPDASQPIDTVAMVAEYEALAARQAKIVQALAQAYHQ